jgi:CRP-like cAMP-binding protein
MIKTTQTLKGLPLLADVPEGMITELSGMIESQTLASGEVLFEKGEAGDALYIIEQGEVKVFAINDDGEEAIYNQMGPGQVIGQWSIVDGEPRIAGVAALSDVEMSKLSRDSLMEVVARQPPSVLDSLRSAANRLKLGYWTFLKQLPLLGTLPDETLAKLAERLETVSLGENEVLFRKGDAGSSLYIIETGWVKIVTKDEKGEELVLNQCGPGQAIGEMSLIDQDPRSASVIAASPSVVMLELDRDGFLEVMEEHPEVALAVMRYLSGRMRWNTTYIEQAIDWSRRIAEGDYDFAMHQIESEQTQLSAEDISDEARATELLSAFFAMVKGVQEREEALKSQLQRLTIEIDEAQAQEDYERLTESDFFAQLKATAEQIRQEASAEEG